MMTEVTLTFAQVAAAAGFAPAADGKLNLPPTQDTADRLAVSARELLTADMGGWKPGDSRVCVILTGAGPVWGHLAIAHALHGHAARLIYAAPNTPPMIIWSHGV
jgi:hypothetical protein